MPEIALIALAWLALAVGQEEAVPRLVGHSDAFMRETTVIVAHQVLDGRPISTGAETLALPSELHCASRCAERAEIGEEPCVAWAWCLAQVGRPPALQCPPTYNLSHCVRQVF